MYVYQCEFGVRRPLRSRGALSSCNNDHLNLLEARKSWPYIGHFGKSSGRCFALNTQCAMLYGGADGTRTHDLCVANRTTGKTLSICLFKSCSHREILRVFRFFPIPYHRLYVTSCFFWPRIGHLGFVDKTLIESPSLVVRCLPTDAS